MLNGRCNFAFQFRRELPVFGDFRWLALFLPLFQLDQGCSGQEEILACVAKGIVLDE